MRSGDYRLWSDLGIRIVFVSLFTHFLSGYLHVFYVGPLYTPTDTERIQAMEMRCLRKLLSITYRDHISKEVVRNRTRQAIGPHEDLLTTVKRRKLKWYGHIPRSTGLAKTILQGTVQGGRRGRQKKRWEDNTP